MENNVFNYIWRYSRHDQLRICFVVLISLPFYFLSLDLPKRIVNDAITGKAFKGGNATVPFLEVDIRWPDWTHLKDLTLFSGFELTQEQLLYSLSLAFLTLVLINGAFKYWINVSKGVLGERMLRRLRFQLFSLMLRFTVEAQREVDASETATIIRDEVEPVGAFIGDAIVTPVTLGTQAATALAFIVIQNPWLGLAAALIVAMQMLIIPRLRREIIRLSRERQIKSRQLAGRVAEVFDGLPIVDAAGTQDWERSEFGGRLYILFDLRLRIYKRKFLVKYVNNLLAQITPFFFYVVGGLLALRGHMDIGQLVAVLAAYRDLPPPLKELIDWDQQRMAVEVNYETVVAHFAAPRLRPDDGPDPGSAVPALGTPLRLRGLAAQDSEDGPPFEWPDVEIALPSRVALSPPAAGGALAALIAGRQTPQAGVVRIGSYDLSTLPDRVRTRRIAYNGSEPFLFPRSIRDNVLYGLRVRPVDLPSGSLDGAMSKACARQRLEASRTGNPLVTTDRRWIDPVAFGCRDAAELDALIVGLLARLGMGDDLYRFGLNALSVVRHDTPVGMRMIRARATLRQYFATPGKSDLLIPFSIDAYNRQGTVSENLLFGVPCDPGLTGRRLAAEPNFRKALSDLGLLKELVDLGRLIGVRLLNEIRDPPEDQAVARRFGLLDVKDLRELGARLGRVGHSGRMGEVDEEALLALAFPYVEAIQRYGFLDDGMQRRIVEARGRVRSGLARRSDGGVQPYDPALINSRMSIADNLLFGRVDASHDEDRRKIDEKIRSVVSENELMPVVQRRGLEHNVGNRGQDLSERQRSKLSIARDLMRRPEILVVDGSITSLEGGARMLFDAAASIPREGGDNASGAASVDGLTLLVTTSPVGDRSMFDFDIAARPPGGPSRQTG